LFPSGTRGPTSEGRKICHEDGPKSSAAELVRSTGRSAKQPDFAGRVEEMAAINHGQRTYADIQSPEEDPWSDEDDDDDDSWKEIFDKQVSRCL